MRLEFALSATLTAACAVIAFREVCLLFAVSGTEKKLRPGKYRKQLGRALITALFACSMAFMACLCGTAMRHGCPLDAPFMAPVRLLEYNALTPVMGRVPDDVRGAVFYLYKYTCPDCRATARDGNFKRDLEAAGAVPVPSDFARRAGPGRDYPIQEVPALVYVYPDGNNYLATVLHRTDVGVVSYDRDKYLKFCRDRGHIETAFPAAEEPDSNQDSDSGQALDVRRRNPKKYGFESKGG